jgi:hypothetical protein
MARGKKHTPEQIVSLLRQVEVGMANRWEAVTEQEACGVGLGRRLHHSQYPSFDRRDPSLLRRQWRIPVAPEGAVLVCPLQPRSHGVGRLLIPVTVIPHRSVLTDYAS